MGHVIAKSVAHVRDWDMAELKRAVVAGGSATPDDVSITRDGRRLDSREAVMAFLEEVNHDLARHAELGE